MDEKMSFIVARLKGDLTMTELCEQFGISRDTGYELWRRYQADGPCGLKPRSRAPHRPAQAMAWEIAEAIVALRQAGAAELGSEEAAGRAAAALAGDRLAGAIDDGRLAAAGGVEQASPPTAPAGTADAAISAGLRAQ